MLNKNILIYVYVTESILHHVFFNEVLQLAIKNVVFLLQRDVDNEGKHANHLL